MKKSLWILQLLRNNDSEQQNKWIIKKKENVFRLKYKCHCVKRIINVFSLYNVLHIPLTFRNSSYSAKEGSLRTNCARTVVSEAVNLSFLNLSTVTKKLRPVCEWSARAVNHTPSAALEDRTPTWQTPTSGRDRILWLSNGNQWNCMTSRDFWPTQELAIIDLQQERVGENRTDTPQAFLSIHSPFFCNWSFFIGERSVGSFDGRETSPYLIKWEQKYTWKYWLNCLHIKLRTTVLYFKRVKDHL